MIPFKCNHCGAALESPASMMGKMETCPECKRKTKVKDPTGAHRWDGDRLEWLVHVAGVTMEGRQAVVKTCKEDEPVHLVREANNPHDSNAVALCVRRGGLKKIGYVPREDAQGIAFCIDNGYEFGESIIRYVRGGEAGLNVGLHVLIKAKYQ